MKRSGFTLIEMLSVIAILAILLIISVPAYQFVLSRIHENSYDNKVKLLLTAAESFSNETNYDVVNVGHLIQEGYVEADNESGDFINPLTDESMLCDVIRIVKQDFQYEARLTEEKNCSFDDLIHESSIITIKKFKESGEEIQENEWYSGDVLLKVEFLDPSQEKNATLLTIKGNGQEYTYDLNGNFSSKNTLLVSAGQILNTKYEASVVVKNDVVREYRASTNVKIDKQRPMVYVDEIHVGNENEWTNVDKKIHFTMSDGNGSGVYGYSLSANSKCGAISPTKTSKQTVSVSKPNGTYYICVRDNAGNWSEDISTKIVTVSKIDTNPPSIDLNSGFLVQSSVSNYNHFVTNLTIQATDESTMSMYLSNTGFEQNGTWEKYSKNKVWNIASSLDGKTHYVYLTLRDEAGNKVNVRSKPYSVYLECSKTKKEYKSGWSSCSASCGGGLKFHPYDIKDQFTNKVCMSGNDQEVCNTHPCENPNDYDWSKQITCSSKNLQEAIDNGKFKEYIEYQGFRDAMYDCASNVEKIILKNSKAIEALRNSSRYELVITKGTKSKSCSEKCPSNCVSDCSNPPACYYESWYTNAISNVYSGRALIISAAAEGRPCFGVVSTCDKYCDYSGTCDFESGSNAVSYWGDILIGQLNGQDEVYVNWYTVKGEYKKGDAALAIKFLNGFGATVIAKYSNFSLSDNSCRSEERTIWRTSNIAIQYFKI